MPVYFFGANGRLRNDGRWLLDVGLYCLKPPDKVVETWDYYGEVRIVPADDVYRRRTCGVFPAGL